MLELGLLALVEKEEERGWWEAGVGGVMIGRGVVKARRASMSTIWWIGVDGEEDIVVVGGWRG